MRSRTFSAPLLLFLLSACATMDPSAGEWEAPSAGEWEAPSPSLANLQRAALYPWTDDGHCVVREASSRLGVSTQAHKDALLRVDRFLNVVVTGCKR